MILTCKVVPKSSKNTLSWYDQEKNILKLNISAPPVDGKANKAIIEFIAQYFKLPKKSVQIVGGEISRLKRISLDCGSKENEVLEKIKLLWC
jgi:hypothetical protein